MKRIIEILSILLIMVTAPGCVNDEVEPVWSLQAGDRLPDFEITLDDGSSVSTEMLKGRKSVIVFFSTGCGDCRRELPVVQDYYDECKKRDPDCFFVCISREEGEASVVTTGKKTGLQCLTPHRLTVVSITFLPHRVFLAAMKQTKIWL